MNHEFITREAKLTATKDIVSAYLSKGAKGENAGPALSTDEVCDFIKKVYATIDETIPSPSQRPVGLG